MQSILQEGNCGGMTEDEVLQYIDSKRLQGRRPHYHVSFRSNDSKFTSLSIYNIQSHNMTGIEVMREIKAFIIKNGIPENTPYLIATDDDPLYNSNSLHWFSKPLTKDNSHWFDTFEELAASRWIGKYRRYSDTVWRFTPKLCEELIERAQNKIEEYSDKILDLQKAKSRYKDRSQSDSEDSSI